MELRELFFVRYEDATKTLDKIATFQKKIVHLTTGETIVIQPGARLSKLEINGNFVKRIELVESGITNAIFDFVDAWVESGATFRQTFSRNPHIKITDK